MESLALQEVSWMAAKPLVDDAQLIKQIGRGDRQALSELYARYQRVLFSYLLQLTPDYGLAEELLQDTLVAVWKSAQGFEGRSSVLTWLIGVARRQAHNTLRQRRIPLANLSEVETMPASDLEPEEAALAGVARAELTEAFHRLAPVHREVLVLTFVQELSYQETATILDVPLGTVKSRLSNARRALRAILDAKEETQR
ncbi:MAG TPA: RNA polymerase sigma factor [Ktedonobacteraceae bacterium]